MRDRASFYCTAPRRTSPIDYPYAVSAITSQNSRNSLSPAATDHHTPRTKRPSGARRRAPLVTSVSIARRQVSGSQPHNRPASSAVSASPGISRYSPTIRRIRSASSSFDLNGGIVEFQDCAMRIWFTVACRTRRRTPPPAELPRRTLDTLAHSTRFHILHRIVRPSGLRRRKRHIPLAAQPDAPDAAADRHGYRRNRRTTAGRNPRHGISRHGAPSSDLQGSFRFRSTPQFDGVTLF